MDHCVEEEANSIHEEQKIENISPSNTSQNLLTEEGHSTRVDTAHQGLSDEQIRPKIKDPRFVRVLHHPYVLSPGLSKLFRNNKPEATSSVDDLQNLLQHPFVLSEEISQLARTWTGNQVMALFLIFVWFSQKQ